MGNACGGDSTVPTVDDPADFEEYFPDFAARAEQRAALLAHAAAKRETRTTASAKTVREVLQNRLIHELLNPCCPEGECLALVLDKHGASVLASIAKMSDVMFPEGTVAIVQNLERKREPSPLMEAVYFVEPTLANIDLIKVDFPARRTRPNMYYGVHILFTSRAPANVVEHLKGSERLLQHLLTVADANLDAVALEPKAFHFGMPKAMPQLYSKSMNQRQRLDVQQLVVDRLVGLCLSLHEYPLIRFRTENTTTQGIATKLQEKMNRHMADDKDFWYHGMERESAMERGTLILVDRREDLVAPLMHEVTVQAMAFDVLEIDEARSVFSYVYDNGTAKETKDMYLNNEKNEVWMNVRHLVHTEAKVEHSKAAAQLQREVEEIKKTNDIRRLDVVSTNSSYSAGTGRLLNALQSEQQRLIRLSMCEGDIATGVGEKEGVLGTTAVAKDHGTLWKDMCELLADVDVNLKEKLRLIAMFMVRSNGLSMDELDELKNVCFPPIPNMDDLANFLHLGCKIQRSGKAPARDPRMLKVHMDQCKALFAQGEYFPVRTIEPKIYHVVKDHLENHLSEQEFSFLVPPPAGYFEEAGSMGGGNGGGRAGGGGTGKSRRTSAMGFFKGFGKGSSGDQADVAPSTPNAGVGGGNAGTKAKGGRSVRKHKLNLHGKSRDHGKQKKGEADVAGEEARPTYQGARVIVFVVGGMTYSEMRAMYRAMGETKREILIGSTHVTTPNKFLNEVLNELGTDAIDKTMADLDEVNLNL